MPGSTNTKDNEPAIDTTAHGKEDSTVETLFVVARTALPLFSTGMNYHIKVFYNAVVHTCVCVCVCVRVCMSVCVSVI